MSVYRHAPAQPSRAPRAPWWRILRAWVTGTFAKLPGAQRCRAYKLDRRRSGLPRSFIAEHLRAKIRLPSVLEIEKMSSALDEVARAAKERRGR